MRERVLFLVLLCFAVAGCNHSHDSKQKFPTTSAAPDVTAQFDVLDGYEVRVWAQTPQLFNPTNIDIDARGRIWAAEGVNYRETWKKQEAIKHPKGDRIVILEDTDDDGACDSSKVFVEDPDLICPLGIAVLGNKVVVSCSPNLIVYTDTDGDDKADKKEILLTGFGGKDHDHGLHAVTGGLDGKWYFNVGNDGPHEVQDKSGWWLHSGSCYVYGPTGNTGNRKSDDGRVWTGGIALRVDPDGKHLTPLGHNFRNCYEIARDSFGDMWQSDNDDDGNRGCRFAWLMPGANQGYFSADGTRTWNADRRPGQETLAAHWHQEDPGVSPLGDNTGAGGPTGVVVYEGGSLSKNLIGSMFDCDAGRNLIWAHLPIADGAGVKFERKTLIVSKAAPKDYVWNAKETSQANWFRPSDVAVGTDGAIYISDWYDPMVGGHGIKDKVGSGRILRLAPRGDRTLPPKLDLNSVQGAIVALNSPAINVRYAAAIKLRDSSAVSQLTKLANVADTIMRARALVILAQCGDEGLKVVEHQLRNSDERIRIAAFRALRSADYRVLENASLLVDDPSPAVRRELAVALRDVPIEKSGFLLMKLAKQYDGKDRFYLEAIGVGCEGKEAAIYRYLVSEDPLKWTASEAGLAWRLHPIASIDAFAARASSKSLSADARQQAIVALAFIRDSKAADAMAKLASSEIVDVKSSADWWLRNRAGNDWEHFEVARRFVEVALADPSLVKQRAEDRKLLVSSDTRRARKPAAIRMAADPEGGMFIVSLAAEGKFPNDMVEVVSGAIYRNPDLSVRAMASKYFPRQTTTGVTLPSVSELAAMKGDAKRGHDVFFGNTASCSRCHAFNGEGRDVGPELTTIRTKLAKPELLDSILNPSANISIGFEPWIIKTNDGQVYGGFIIADGESVVLKESSGEKRTFAKKDIKSRTRQTMSVMPDNVGLGLSAQEIADIAEYLLTTPVKIPAASDKTLK